MVSKDMWHAIYNRVFALFLPPQDIILKVTYNDDGKIKDFKSVVELMAYVALNTDKTIIQKDISFILKDDSLLEMCESYYNDICKVVKEKS